MMVCPEYIYNTEMKGKDADTLLRLIRSLKRHIGRNKKILEHPDGNERALRIHPSPDVKINVSREYLEYAKKALAEAGGIYEPTAAEKRVEEINRSLTSLSAVEFTIDRFLAGITKHRIVFGDTLEYHYSSFPDMDREEERTPHFDKDDLTYMLNSLYLGEWKHDYMDPYVCDGYSWELILTFSDGRRKLRYQGMNAYPWCFKTLLVFFEEDTDIDQ